MAENENGTEKSEQPTGRRIQKSRQEGQVARSKELATTVVLISGAIALLLFGQTIGESLGRLFRYSFDVPRDALFDTGSMSQHLLAMTKDITFAMIPFMSVMVVAAVVGHVGLGGWLFSMKNLEPKLSKFNPITGIKRLFKLRSLVELVKALGKTLIIGTMAWFIMRMDIPGLLEMGREDLSVSMVHAMDLLAWTFFWLACSLILIAAIDVPYQVFEHNKELRMTKQEVKEEFRDTEGKPEVKQKVRQIQYNMAQQRMLQEVPKADVVITNPTHYSVALRYDSKRDRAPVVVAKGIDHMAIKIREIAKAHKIEMVASPALTRSVYHHTDVGGEIPSGLYLAVAQILAYVFQLRRYRRGWAGRPGNIPAFEIPADLRKD
jgi:flagellar biosynthetic protein FlhB